MSANHPKAAIGQNWSKLSAIDPFRPVVTTLKIVPIELNLSQNLNMTPSDLRNTLTPEQALRHAFWSIKLPSLILMFGPWAVAYALVEIAEQRPEFESMALTSFVILFFGGFVAGWLVWSIQVPKWRLWAYARVTDIDELKRLAVARKYLWPDGHFFERTEIASKELRTRILQLEESRQQEHNGQ